MRGNRKREESWGEMGRRWRAGEERERKRAGPGGKCL